jgi:hypothetical protein
MKQLLIIVAMALLNQDRMKAQNIQSEEVKGCISALQSKIDIPKTFHFQSAKKVQVDGVPAFVVRYEKQENKGAKGEHFSFVISEKDKQILGFTNMDKKYADLKMLSKSETERIAKDFLLKLDRDLAKDLKNLWIERHDEEIIVDGKPTVIAGMKYKCYRASNNDYAWVIVGYDGSVITFERNIKWNNNEQKRITEKWLHDNWLSEKQ